MNAVAVGPMYNEAEKTLSVIQRFPAGAVKEVVVVNDCSTDGSLAIARRWIEGNRDRFQYSALLKNQINLV